jgi:alkylation response protein AidB-like acyl-CoA dehydrogenase
MAHNSTQAGLLARVQQLAPVIREYADQGERERHLADPLVTALQDAGLYGLLVPRALGGLQVDPLTFYHVVEALARVDGSTGWCIFINGAAACCAAFLGAEAAAAIYRTGARTIMSGTVFPCGQAVPQEGGYRVSGHWGYASGCWHATWHLGFCHVYDDGATSPRVGPTGVPELVVTHFPRAQMQIRDTWDVGGLSATGSHEVLVERVFVPAAFVWPFVPHAARGQAFAGPLYRFPFASFFSGPIAAVALGIAQGALDAVTELAHQQTSRLVPGALREQPLFHTQLAQAVALVRAARAWLYAVLGQVWEQTVGGARASWEDHAALLLAATNATRSAAAAVELAYTTGGGSANYRRSPLQRQMRDMHAVTQHIGTAPVQYETSGRMLLGLPPGNPFILFDTLSGDEEAASTA